MTPNKALQSDKIAGYAANFAAEREALDDMQIVQCLPCRYICHLHILID
jgi:hypothetical protein